MMAAARLSLTLLSFCTLLLTTAAWLPDNTFLRVSGKNFIYGSNNNLFLNGMNLPYFSYGCDFGDCKYQSQNRQHLVPWLDAIRDSGGNSARVWIHTTGGEGSYVHASPRFDGNGYVTAPGRCSNPGQDFVSEVKQFLDEARSRDILIIFVLWNGAMNPYWTLKGVIEDSWKLHSYLDHFIQPFMTSDIVKHPALGAIEIMNEPEGLVKQEWNADNCFNTQRLAGTGAGWTGNFYYQDQLAKFVGAIAGAIHYYSAQKGRTVPVTIGSWSELPQSSNSFSNGKGFNYYADYCLKAAVTSLAQSNSHFRTFINYAFVDFYQTHTYKQTDGNFWPNSPFRHNYSHYLLDKPLVIGEFSQAAGNNIQSMHWHLLNNGYHGAWNWQARGNAGDKHADTLDICKAGVAALRSQQRTCLTCNVPIFG